MQVSHLGHAALLVETESARILIDPGSLSDDWVGVTDLTMVVVTHQHADHVDLDRVPALLTVNPGVQVVTESATAALLAAHDVTATVLTADTQLRTGNLTVTGFETDHARIHPHIPLIPNLGVVVEHDAGARILHPGDALAVTPVVDVVALPLSAPWASLGMLADWAVEVAAPHMVPIHDALLSPTGRAIHLRLLREVTGDLAMADLSDGSRLTL